MANPNVDIVQVVTNSKTTVPLSQAVATIRANPDAWVMRPPRETAGAAFVAAALLSLFQDSIGDPTATSDDLLDAVALGLSTIETAPQSLLSSLETKGLTVNSTRINVWPQLFGPCGNGNQAQDEAAWDLMRTSVGAGDCIDLLGKTYILGKPYTFSQAGLKIINGFIQVAGTANWGIDDYSQTTTSANGLPNALAAIKFQGAYSEIKDVEFTAATGSTGNGVILDAFRCRVQGCRFIALKRYGIYVSGGGCSVEDSYGTQVGFQTAASYDPNARTMRFIWLHDNDAKMNNNISAMCAWGLYISLGSGLFTGNHFWDNVWSGGSSPGPAPATLATYLIYVGENATACTFVNHYFDTGTCVFRNSRIAIIAPKLIWDRENSQNQTASTCFFQFVATTSPAGGQTLTDFYLPPCFVPQFVPHLAQRDTDGGTWAASTEWIDTLTGAALQFGTGIIATSGVGDPNTSGIAANPGSIYTRTNGGAENRSVYIKASGNSTSGWKPLRQIDGVNVAGSGADFTLTAGTDKTTQIRTAAYTGDKVCTLATSVSGASPIEGDRFIIVRKDATAAHTLTVQDDAATPNVLKVIPNSTAARVEVEFDGTNWQLIGYGTL